MSSKDLRKQQIMEVASRMFVRFGYRRTSIDDIVRDVGIAKGSFYSYFQSKEDLFKQIIEDNHQNLLKSTIEVVEQGKNPCEKIRLLVFNSLSGLEKYPLLIKYVDQDPDLALPPELNLCEQEACKRRQIMADDFFAKIITDGIESGHFSADLDVHAAVAILISLFHVYLYNQKFQFVEEKVEEFMQNMLNIFFNGILICDPDKPREQV
jgi:AcrR family transcriptional regulator